MTTDTRRAPLSLPRRLAFGLAMLALIYGAIEGLAYLAYRPILGESFHEPVAAAAPEVAAAEPDSSLITAVREGREQAGLGFQDPNMSLHPYLGYVYTPKKPGEKPGRVAISPDGFLDTAPAVRQRDETRWLVGIMGGSVAGQLGTWHSQRLREALARNPDLASREIEFIKLGMPGYHQPQQLQQLAYILAQGGEFDILLNIDGFNEVAVPGVLNTPKGAHPLFPMNWSMVALDTPDPVLRRHVGAVAFLQEERGRRAQKFLDSLQSKSVLGKLLWRRGDQRLEQQLADHAWQLQEYPLGEIPFFVHGPRKDHDPAGGLVPWLVEIWKRSSLQMQTLCQANGIRYYHFLQPNQYLPESKPLSGEEMEKAFDKESPYRPIIEEGYPLLRQVGAELRAAGVEFHDLSMIFGGVDETLYVDSCCHFNGEGNEIMAAAISDVLSM